MARLVITDGSTSRIVELTDAITVAGRAPENKIVIDDKQSSRRHFQIEKTDLGFKVVDLESRNGTRVNDRQVNQALLRPGDRILIGKHLLTFEDANFREPPAEVAARLAPSTAPAAGRVEAPSTGPDSTPDRPAAAALPVATEVPRPAVAVSPSPPADDYRAKRNRSGHTTTVQKNFNSQLKEEQKTLTMVAVGAGVFIFVVLLLIFIPGGGGGSDASGAKSPAKGAPGISDVDRLEKEAHDFEELSNFCDRNKNTPGSFNEIISRVDQFEQKHPRGVNIGKAREFRAAAANGLKTSRNAEFTEAEKHAQEDLQKKDFVGGFKKIRDLLAKYKADPDIHERLVRLKDQAVEDARSYFQEKIKDAEALKFSRKDEAREAYQALLKVMGNGSVPELDDYCKICQVTLEGLQ
jgi:pSer/pThr/pTyr-binding forkhead associated (FHA) protein